MSRKAPGSVDDYLATLDAPQRTALARVREAIRKGIPSAEEAISYGIPAFMVGGRSVIYCAAFKEHYSVYPATAALVEALGEALAPYEYNGKGTIRFPLDRPVPVRLVARIARLRAAEEAERQSARPRRSRR